MIRHLVLGFFLLVPPVQASSDGLRVRYNIEVDHEGDEKSKMENEFFITKDAVRLENINAAYPTENLVVVRSKKTKVDVVAYPAMKVYVDRSAVSLKAVMTPSPSPRFVPTGKTKKIAGYSCDVLARDSSDSHEEVCVTSSFGDRFADMKASIQDLNESMLGTIISDLSKIPLEYTLKSMVNGRVTSQMRISILAQTLQQETFSPSTFEIPKNFKHR